MKLNGHGSLLQFGHTVSSLRLSLMQAPLSAQSMVLGQVLAFLGINSFNFSKVMLRPLIAIGVEINKLAKPMEPSILKITITLLLGEASRIRLDLIHVLVLTLMNGQKLLQLKRNKSSAMQVVIP